MDWRPMMNFRTVFGPAPFAGVNIVACYDLGAGNVYASKRRI